MDPTPPSRQDARVSFQTMRRLLRLLREEVSRARRILPTGQLDEDTGEPQDLDAWLQATCEHFDDEFLSPLDEQLERGLRWIDGTEEPPALPPEVPPAELDRRT